MKYVKVVVPFTAKEGDHVLIVNGVCVGVGKKPVDTAMFGSDFETDHDTVFGLFEASHHPLTAHQLAEKLHIPRADRVRRAALSEHIRALCKSARIVKVDGASRMGPYEVTQNRSRA